MALSIAALPVTDEVEPVRIAASRGLPERPNPLPVLPVLPELQPLFPDQGIRPGSVLALNTGSPGSTSLLLALLAGPTTRGAWTAVVGCPALGLESAAELGAEISRLALVPSPGDRWPEVVATLLDGCDLVAVVPPGRPRPRDARRLVARARERGSALVVLETGGPFARWPEPVDLTLDVMTVSWEAFGQEHGTLDRRQMTVRSVGRRAGSRERRARLWLPGPDGRVHPAPAAPQPIGTLAR